MRPSANENTTIDLIDESPKKQTTSLSQKSKSSSNHQSESSDIDTEDEIERITQKQKQAKKDTEKKLEEADKHEESPVKRKKLDNEDIYDKTTEEDERKTNQNNNDSTSISPLPEFFEKKTFYLCDNLSSVDIIKLRRFITVYKGEIIDRADTADYVISNQLLSSSSKTIYGEIVKPLWIFECNDMECLLPTKRYKF